MTRTKKTLYSVIIIIALTVSLYLTLVYVVWNSTQQHFFRWNVFPYMMYLEFFRSYWIIFFLILVFVLGFFGTILYCIEKICSFCNQNFKFNQKFILRRKIYS